MRAYEGMQKKPVIDATKNTFKIILPNIDASHHPTNDGPSDLKSVTGPVARGKEYLSDEEKVLEHALSQDVITRNVVIGLPDISTATASKIIRRSVDG